MEKNFFYVEIYIFLIKSRKYYPGMLLNCINLVIKCFFKNVNVSKL